MAKYLTNKDLYKEVVVCKAQGKLSNRLSIMFMMIAKGVIKKRYYVNTQDREDAYSGALEDMLRFWYNFDAERFDNAFAYFTEIAKRGMAKSWNKMYNPYSLDGQVIISLDDLLL